MKKSIKIGIWCLVIGLLLAFFGLDPLELWVGVGETAGDAAAAGGSVLMWAGPYMLVGAIIVIPLVGGSWLMKRMKQRKSDKSPS